MNKLLLVYLLLFITGCAMKTPIQSQSATILIKTPTMKFYDKGFITKYSDYTHVQIYSAGQTVLDLMIYENQVCQSTFKCLSAKEFNATYLHASYENQFLQELFNKTEQSIVHRDKANKVLIKIEKD